MVDWAKIKGLNFYAVSDGTIVKSTSKLRNIYDGIPVEQKYLLGYMTVVRLSKNVGRRFVHKIILEAFVDRPEPNSVAVHKNGNRLDNRLENLEWITRQGYQERIKKLFDDCEEKKRRKCHKLTEMEVSEIRQKFIPYSSDFGVLSLARKYGVCIPQLSKVVKDLKNRGKRDEVHYHAILSKSSILMIKKNYKPRDQVFGRRPLANQFGISETHITRIINREQWKNI